MNNLNDLLQNIEKLHTTKLGIDRIKNNLGLQINDVVDWCKKRIIDESSMISRQGKNWYITTESSVITVNAYSYTIITAHLKK